MVIGYVYGIFAHCESSNFQRNVTCMISHENTRKAVILEAQHSTEAHRAMFKLGAKNLLVLCLLVKNVSAVYSADRCDFLSV